jgi:ubiquinone/menaquinone biosynthesis C-methylase UbiE
VWRIVAGQSNTWWDYQDPTYLSEHFLRDPVEGVGHPSRQYIRDWLRIHPGALLLDIPCGPGVEYEGFQREQVPVQYIGMDASDAMLTICRRKYPDAEFRKGDICRIPLPDRSVDVVFCRHILEHLKDYRPAVREAVRVARDRVFFVLFRAPTQTERAYLGYGAWDNRLDWGELATFLQSLGIHYSTTQLRYGHIVPLGIEENVIIEVAVQTRDRVARVGGRDF